MYSGVGDDQTPLFTAPLVEKPAFYTLDPPKRAVAAAPSEWPKIALVVGVLVIGGYVLLGRH